MGGIKDFFIFYKRLFLIFLGLFLISLIIILSLPIKKKELRRENAPSAALPGEGLLNAVNQKTVSEEDKEKARLAIVAKNFAEIYGTYSNQSNFINLETVMPLLSSNYKKEMTDFLGKLRAAARPEAEYRGMTTVAITWAAESLEDAGASVVVKTQRKETAAGGETVKYQDLRLQLVKENNEWLVDKAEWMK